MSSRIITVKCLNIVHCGHINQFPESELVSGMTMKDDQGAIIEEHPQVTIDENTFVKCEACGYPISCAHAVISN